MEWVVMENPFFHDACVPLPDKRQAARQPDRLQKTVSDGGAGTNTRRCRLLGRSRNDFHRAALHDRVLDGREIDLSLAHGDINAVTVQEIGAKNQYLA